MSRARPRRLQARIRSIASAQLAILRRSHAKLMWRRLKRKIGRCAGKTNAGSVATHTYRRCIEQLNCRVVARPAAPLPHVKA